MTEKQEQDRSIELAESVAIDLRVVLMDAKAELDEFADYIESWDKRVAACKEDPAAHDPRDLTETHVIAHALQMIEEVAHMHNSSTRANNWRRARTRLVQLAGAAEAARLRRDIMESRTGAEGATNGQLIRRALRSVLRGSQR